MRALAITGMVTAALISLIIYKWSAGGQAGGSSRCVTAQQWSGTRRENVPEPCGACMHLAPSNLQQQRRQQQQQSNSTTGKHLGVGHAGHAAVAADVGGHALQGHDGHSARLLSDTRLLGSHHIHDHATCRVMGSTHVGCQTVQGQRRRCC